MFMVPFSVFSFFPGSRDCLPPAVSFRRRRLAQRPDYMRSSAGPGIGFPSPAVGMLSRVPGGACGEESHRSESRAGQCSLDPGGQRPGLSVRSTAAPAVTSVGHLGLALASARGTSARFGTQPRAGTRLPDRPSGPCGPGNAGCQQEFPSMDGPQALRASWDAACREGARGTQAAGPVAPAELSGSSCSLGSGPSARSAPPGNHDAFTSSFSFIRLSLGSAGERGEAEGCPPSREAECHHQSPREVGAKAASSDRPHEDPRYLSWPLDLSPAQGSADPAWAAGSGPGPEYEMPSCLDVDAGSSWSPDPLLAGCGGDEGSGSGDAHPWDAHPWDALLRRWEPVLQGCLLSSRRQVEVTSLRLKLQKLQGAAVEDDDYDKAETLKQRLEDLEQEKRSLHFQLPSKQPSLSSFLGHLAAQAQAALHHRAAQQASSDDSQAPLRMEPWPLEPTAQDNLRVSITRRDWLLQEKQQLQKEIEALQARMSVLEAKDQQLRREIEEQEQQLQWGGCGLTPLLRRLSLGQLQEVVKALQDTLASANRIPFRAEPPETIRSLQERMKSLNLSLKEITAKVCMSERLCSTLRKAVNDIETQLPALLEARMLAISGNHFCTAKDLTEEIRSLTSEREGLEGLLSRLLVLSSRNGKKLGSVKEDYDRLRRELERQETAYETCVKENTVKYMEMLEGKLCSCTCPLLGKVWEADLEACRLLIQSLQLQEARGSPSVEDERQMEDAEGAVCADTAAVHHRPHSEDERKTPLQESYVLSAELGEKCEAIGKKLMRLEDQLHTAIRSHDEDLIQSLKRELQMVKETLQALSLQLQPAKEVGDREAAASCVTAGVREAQA
ncbi:disrupted in schizophrenia 1 protein isoform X2 [Eulemur rufifrons]|uniref:disrupted in schizophrenia 1 protein isoform X2 n=1 Tax=Eulemur rufifrons TaxID=859984 RepID=UPI003742EEE6